MPRKYNSISFPPERVRELYDYDYETGFLISKKSSNKGKPLIGALSKDKRMWTVQLYYGDGSKTKTNYGRVVFCWHHGRWPDDTIDHIDRDPRNNRIENLRELSDQLQVQNTGKFNFGAIWREGFNRWEAKIYTNGKDKYLGLFKTEKAAQEAYMTECDRIGRQYFTPYLFNDRYVAEERVMGIR